MRAMILAAGEGTRLRPYTETLPKPAIPMLNVPLGYYSLHHILNLGITEVVVNTFHLPKKIHEVFEAAPYKPKTLHFSDETGSILGSGGGLATAKRWLQGDSVLLMNGDEVIIPHDGHGLGLIENRSGEFERFKQAFESKKPLSLLLTMEHPEAGKQFGAIWVDDNDRVWGFGKSPPQIGEQRVSDNGDRSGDGAQNNQSSSSGISARNIEGKLKPLHFLGCQILAPEIFSYLPEAVESNILYDGLTKAISEGQVVRAHRIQCDWYETGNPQDFLECTGELLKTLSDSKGKGHQFLSQFLKKWTPSSELTTMAQGLVFKSKMASLSPNTKIKGFAIIGDGAKVESSEVTNLVASAGVRIVSPVVSGIVLK